MFKNMFEKVKKDCYFFYFWTNLGPIQVELIVEHFIRPQCCKSWILEDLTDIVILGPTITLCF